MDMAVGNCTSELETLLEKYQSRPGIGPLRSRVLPGFRVEIEAALALGHPVKEVWRALGRCGYRGSYPQFARTVRRFSHPDPPRVTKKVLRPPLEGKALEPLETAATALSPSPTKPEWQIRRERLMAELDRQAEENRRREEELKPKKVFTVTPFVGRQG